MHTWHCEVWACGSAAACTHGSGMVGHVAQLQHAYMAAGLVWASGSAAACIHSSWDCLGRWLSCSMHTWQWDGWASGSAATRIHGSWYGWVGGSTAACTHGSWGGWTGGSTAACTHVSGMIGQVAKLQHAHMALGGLGKWLSCSMHTWQCDGWASGLAAACIHGSWVVGQVAQVQHAHMAL